MMELLALRMSSLPFCNVVAHRKFVMALDNLSQCLVCSPELQTDGDFPFSGKGLTGTLLGSLKLGHCLQYWVKNVVSNTQSQHNFALLTLLVTYSSLPADLLWFIKVTEVMSIASVLLVNLVKTLKKHSLSKLNISCKYLWVPLIAAVSTCSYYLTSANK